MTKLEVKMIAGNTATAYSFGRYISWAACIRMLDRRGYSQRQIEAILRSKWMRWAGDASPRYNKKCAAADLTRWMDDPRNRITAAEVEALTCNTFPEVKGD